MNKENILYAIIGIMVGLIIGFLFANSYIRSELASGKITAAGTMQQNSNMPAGHPDINGQNGQMPQQAPVSPDLQPATDFAKANPTDFQAQVKAAELSSQAEMFDKAVDFLTIANKLKPEDYQTIVALGNAYFDGGNLEDAEKWYSAALQKKKDDNNVRTDLGLTFVFREKADFDRAIQEFNTVLATEPNHIQALQNSVVAYLKKGDIAKAKERLAKLESADPKNPAIARLKTEIGKTETK